jgi:hypothetical protein
MGGIICSLASAADSEMAFVASLTHLRIHDKHTLTPEI